AAAVTGLVFSGHGKVLVCPVRRSRTGRSLLRPLGRAPSSWAEVGAWNVNLPVPGPHHSAGPGHHPGSVGWRWVGGESSRLPVGATRSSCHRAGKSWSGGGTLRLGQR